MEDSAGKAHFLELQKLYKKLLEKGRIDWIESKKQTKCLSPKMVRNIHQISASAMKLAKEQRFIATDSAEGCVLPKLKRKEMKTLPIEQLASFLRDARNSRIFEMYYVELAARLRRGELLSPKWDQQKNRRCLPENQERLPDASGVRGHHPGSETTEKRNWQQSLGVSLTY